MRWDGPTTSRTPSSGLVIHADWSTTRKKRRVAEAVRSHGAYRADAGTEWTVQRFQSLLAHPPDDGAVLGFDFPIGLPVCYARRAGIRTFRAFLGRLARGAWPTFWTPATKPEEICVKRPFYPGGRVEKGRCKKDHLRVALGVGALHELMRRCDRGHAYRRPAECMFWTIGAKQVGKALIAGWQEILIPCLTRCAQDVALWPFDGEFASLVGSRRIVIVETYPAEYYRHLDPPRVVKTNHECRKACGKRLLQQAEELGVECSEALKRRIEAAFGTGELAPDDFDAVVGLFGMLKAIVRGTTGAPLDADVRRIEGWIFGQDPLSAPEAGVRRQGRRDDEDACIAYQSLGGRECLTTLDLARREEGAP